MWRRLEENSGQRQSYRKGHRHELTVDKYRCGALTAAGDHHEGSSDSSELPVWRRFPQTLHSIFSEEEEEEEEKEGAVMAQPGSRGWW